MPRQLLVQISDPHLRCSDPAPARALAAAVAWIGRMEPPPVAVLLTGDIADGGDPAEYRQARELLAPLAMPVHPLPGNHDDRDALRAAWADHPGVASSHGPVQYAADCGDLRVVVLDTSEPGQNGGRLDAARLAFLEAELAAGDGPVLVALHHHPALSGIRAMDAIALAPEDRAALQAVVERSDRVQAILGGHVHRGFTSRLGRCPVFACPSVHRQALLDLAGDRLELVDGEPPAIAIHLRPGDGPLASHVQPL
ncbi:MAG: metallophosphoesterase [Solirubrobacteraceae bacterium]